MTMKFEERFANPRPMQTLWDERPHGLAEWGDQGQARTWPRARVQWRTCAGLAAFFLAVSAVNILTVQQDAGGQLAGWKPIVWETSSGLLSISLSPLVSLLSQAAPFDQRRLLRFVGVHLAASIAYSLVHVGGFVALRALAYASLGHRYDFSAYRELVYEYRKDLVTYALALIIFSLSARRSLPAALAPENRAEARAEARAAVFDIRDGTRVIRTPVTEILFVRSARNYVEFHLADGRRPLMRTTLLTLESELGPHGFLRTHRSWLVNPERVRAIMPEGSKDYRIEFDKGVAAPVSRRFPAALKALRRAD